MIEDEDRKTRKFLQGLWDDICKQLATLKLTTYADTLDRALIHEQELAKDEFFKKRSSDKSGISASSGASSGRPFKSPSRF
ncbi:hypothetical protein Nepgr_013633 [Nepenthes gracilis]|uniref:Uncharacterized protein n=1 Tax=Nepenthes gracilis TaxID=150966 RepID=A0AAD3SJL6_NEPGR|nr:hypothetical protein Nepgr_013633 [Nepenthes gracilis]